MSENPKLERIERLIARVAKGEPKNVVAKDGGITVQTLDTYINRMYEGTLHDIGKHKHRRESKITETMALSLERIRKNPRRASLRKQASYLEGQGVPVAPATIARHHKSMGRKPRRLEKKTKLSAAQKLRRKEFATNYRDQDWESTMITDEKDFVLIPDKVSKNDTMWLRSDEDRPKREVVKFPTKFKVWGGITIHGGVLCFYEGTMNAEKYKGILTRHVFPAGDKLFGSKDWCLQQDGAKAHIAKATLKELNKRGEPFTYIPPEDWPPNSPDLSPIENVWGMMDHELQQMKLTTSEVMKGRISRLFHKLVDEHKEALFASIPHRLQECLDRHGDYVGY